MISKEWNGLERSQLMLLKENNGPEWGQLINGLERIQMINVMLKECNGLEKSQLMNGLERT